MHKWRKEKKKDFRQRKRKEDFQENRDNCRAHTYLGSDQQTESVHACLSFVEKQSAQLGLLKVGECVVHNSKQLQPSENNKNVKHMLYTTASVTIGEQQNITHMLYITATNCHHQRTTKCQTHVINNSKKLSPSQNNKNVKHMLYTTASNCHHWKTTKVSNTRRTQQ